MMNHYEVLRVTRDAEPKAIKAAWRAFARRFHTDHNPDPRAAEVFKRGKEAWEVLGDPARRAEYDRTLGPLPAAKCRICRKVPPAVGLPICLLCALQAVEAGGKRDQKPQSVAEEFAWLGDPATLGRRMRRTPADVAPLKRNERRLTSDELLAALLSESALRSAVHQAQFGEEDEGLRIDVEIKPSAQHMKLLRRIGRNLELANRLWRPLTDWLTGG